MKFANVGKQKLVLFATLIACLLATSFVAAYSNGYRLTTFPPDNNWVCQGNVDLPAGYKPPVLTEVEKKFSDMQFDKYCPGYRSGWLWGDWWITKPHADGRSYDSIYVATFWRPYWGFIFPDYNLGVAYLTLTQKH